MGLDLSLAFRLFVTQVIRQKKLPFEIVVNEELLNELSKKDTKKLLEIIKKDDRGELKFYSDSEITQRLVKKGIQW